MRIPETPPAFMSVLQQSPSSVASLMNLGLAPTYKGRYLHWDKLRRLPLPAPIKAAGLSQEEWWAGLKLARRPAKAVGLVDASGKPFVFGTPDPVPEKLHYLDQHAGAILGAADQVTNSSARDQYLIHSLTEEAITSSQLEGAVTTRQVAKQMLRSGRVPRDVSERMIFNNYQAMQQIREYRNESLTPEILLELHRTLTHGTLEKHDAAGRFRIAGERIVVGDDYGEVFHTPPDAALLPERIQRLCAFANATEPGYFIHPIVRAIILHFWLAYDHPFVDGNGRCARALLYWSMLHSGYWLSEFISISQIVRKAPVRYGRAFLYTETDDNDLTYFLLYHLEVLCDAFKELHAYIDRKTKEVRETERVLRNSEAFNPRQLALLSHALRHPDARYTIQEHQADHHVVYETARTDLLQLAALGYLIQKRRGKGFSFYPAADLADRFAKT